jgi:hypothetical protein
MTGAETGLPWPTSSTAQADRTPLESFAQTIADLSSHDRAKLADMLGGPSATMLFATDQAHTGPCTARSTIHCANVAAGPMTAQLTKWLRGMAVDADVQLNLPAGEMVVM